MKKWVALLASFLICASTFSASVQLSWTRPEDDFYIQGYRVGYGLWSGVYNVQTVVGDVDSCTIYGLTPGRTYYIALKFYTFDGEESAWSDEMIYVPAISLLPPSLKQPVLDSLQFCFN